MTVILAMAMISNVVTQGMAQASAPHGAIFELVICSTDGGESVIHVDADGNRIDPEEQCATTPCSDCLMSGIQALGAAPATLRQQVRSIDTPNVAPFPFTLQRWPGSRTARGPPLKV